MAVSSGRGTSPLSIRIARRALGVAAPRLLKRIQAARLRDRYTRAPESGPRLLLLEATTACNYRCLMCTDHGPYKPNDTPSQHMPWDQVERLIRDAAALGTDMVWLAGRGEPLCHPEAQRTVALIGSLGLKPLITTNGALLTEALADELCDAGLYQLSVSLNSGCPATYAEVHGAAAEERARLLALLRRVTKRPNPPTTIASMVLLKQNAHELLDFTRDAIAAGVHSIAFLGLRFAPVLSQVALEDWAPVHRDLSTAAELARQAGVVFRADGVPDPPAGASSTAPGSPSPPPPSHWTLGCYIGHLFTRVDVEGNLHGCCSCGNYLGSLAGSSFAEQWQSRAYQYFRWLCRELPVSKTSPPGCSCVDCGNIADNWQAFTAMGFQAAPRRVEDGFASRLGLAEIVWRHLGDALPKNGRAAAYTDLTPEAAGPAWPAVAGLHTAGVMTGLPRDDGNAFLPSDMALCVQAAEVLRRSAVAAGLTAEAAQQLVASGAPHAADRDMLQWREIDAWARTVRAGLPKTAR